MIAVGRCKRCGNSNASVVFLRSYNGKVDAMNISCAGCRSKMREDFVPSAPSRFDYTEVNLDRFRDLISTLIKDDTDGF